MFLGRSYWFPLGWRNWNLSRSLNASHQRHCFNPTDALCGAWHAVELYSYIKNWSLAVRFKFLDPSSLPYPSHASDKMQLATRVSSSASGGPTGGPTGAGAGAATSTGAVTDTMAGTSALSTWYLWSWFHLGSVADFYCIFSPPPLTWTKLNERPTKGT